jgi:hypothetical protein
MLPDRSKWSLADLLNMLLAMGTMSNTRLGEELVIMGGPI